MTDSTNLSEGQAAQPHPDLTSLDRLVGTWAVSGFLSDLDRLGDRLSVVEAYQ